MLPVYAGSTRFRLGSVKMVGVLTPHDHPLPRDTAAISSTSDTFGSPSHMVSRDSSRKLSQELRTRGFVVIRGFLPEKNTRLPPVDGGSFMFCADDGICTQACDDEKVTDELRTAAKSMAEVIAHRGNQLFAGPLKQPRKVVARPAETWFRRKVKNAPETPQHCDIYYHARETHPGLFDCAYQDWTQPLIYTLWVMLKRGKSSLVLLPGGHLGAEWDRGGKSVELPAKRHAFGQVVVLNDLAPGDAVVFHCKTPHFSIASEGSGPRMSMDQRFWADPVDPESPKAVRAAQLVERSADIIARLFTGASTDYKGMSAGQQKEEAINLVCLWSVIGCLQPRSVNVKPWLSLLPAPLSADSKSELNFFGFEKGNRFVSETPCVTPPNNSLFQRKEARGESSYDVA